MKPIVQRPKQIILKGMIWLPLVPTVHICIQFSGNWMTKSWDKYLLALGHLGLWVKTREDFHVLCRAVQWWSSLVIAEGVAISSGAFAVGTVFLLTALSKTSKTEFSSQKTYLHWYQQCKNVQLTVPLLLSVQIAKFCLQWQGIYSCKETTSQV